MTARVRPPRLVLVTCAFAPPLRALSPRRKRACASASTRAPSGHSPSSSWRATAWNAASGEACPNRTRARPRRPPSSRSDRSRRSSRPCSFRTRRTKASWGSTTRGPLSPMGLSLGQRDETVTFHHLASHRSGLPRLPSNFAPDRSLPALRRLRPAEAPGLPRRVALARGPGNAATPTRTSARASSATFSPLPRTRPTRSSSMIASRGRWG